MGILDNFENAWDDFEFESKPIIETNNLGEKIQGYTRTISGRRSNRQLKPSIDLLRGL